MESYRDETGKVKHRTLLNIGRLNNLFALLPKQIQEGNIPDNYDIANISSEDVSLGSIQCKCHGSPIFLYRISKWLDIEKIMEEVFPYGSDHNIARSKSLLLAAVHRACCPGSKKSFRNWFKYTSLPEYAKVDPNVLTSQHFWDQMDEITPDQIREFENKLFLKILRQFPNLKNEMNCLSTDFTNYYTYISTKNFRCETAQLGHSKEVRSGQKIFSVAVVTSPLLGIPIATMVYRGNYNDKTALKEFMTLLKERVKELIPLKDITFVFDGGGASEDTLNQIPGHFITRGSFTGAHELYDIPLDMYKAYKIAEDVSVTAYRTVSKQYNKNRTVVISLSEDLKDGQKAEMEKRITQFKKSIEELNIKLDNSRATIDKRLNAIESRMDVLMQDAFYFSNFIKITYTTKEEIDPIIKCQYKKAIRTDKTKKTEGVQIGNLLIKNETDIPLSTVVTSVNFVIDEEKKNQVIDKYYGKHILVTDQNDWDTIRILKTYRDQEAVERFFRDSKNTNHFSVRPVYHWTDQKINVHVMLCYLGMTLCKIGQYMLKDKFGYEISGTELLDRLEKVQECISVIDIQNVKLKYQKKICSLYDKEAETWDMVQKLLEYLNTKGID